jgi:DNA transformation protein and related proteins
MIDFGYAAGMGAPSKGRTRRLEPLTVTDAFKTFVLDQLDELGDVTPRAMFGGVGLYYRDVFFGIIARDVLYMKVDETNQPAYERAGMRPFMPYPGRDENARAKYYAVPTEILESASDLASWARQSVAAAERSAAGKARPGRARRVKKGPAVSRRSRRRNSN